MENKKNNNQNQSQTENKPEPRKIKLNLEKYKDFKYTQTNRSQDEETETKPRLIHVPRGKKESDGYYYTRKLAFTLTQKEYRTPQNNIVLIRDFLNTKLPKGKKLTSRMNYVARDYGLKFFPEHLPENEFILIDVRKNWTLETLLAKFK